MVKTCEGCLVSKPTIDVCRSCFKKADARAKEQAAMIKLLEDAITGLLAKQGLTPEMEENLKEAIRRAHTESSKPWREVLNIPPQAAGKDENLIDTDLIMTGFRHSHKETFWSILEIVKDMQDTEGVSLDDVMRVAEEKGISMTEADKCIERLKREGRIYEKLEGGFRIA